MKIKILYIISALFLFLSCKRTNLNKYCIKSIDVEILSLKQNNEIYFKPDSILINDKNKKYLILFTIIKGFVSVNPNKDGYPNEGMDGRFDSIVSSNINLKSDEEICIKTNIDGLSNYSNKELVKSSESDEVCIDKNISFRKFIEYYNNERDESYGSEKYFVPFVVDYNVYKKFISENKYIRTKSKNKIKTFYIHSTVQ
jgi:hypothetical protein